MPSCRPASSPPPEPPGLPGGLTFSGNRIGRLSPRLRVLWYLLSLGVVVALWLIAQPLSGADTGVVVRVLDARRLEVRVRDRLERVRLIGVAEPPAPQAAAAAAHVQALAQGREARLVTDVRTHDADGRRLVYVVLDAAGEDLMLNAELVRLGLARVEITPPNTRHRDLLLQLEDEARRGRRGLWGRPPGPSGRSSGRVARAYAEDLVVRVRLGTRGRRACVTLRVDLPGQGRKEAGSADESAPTRQRSVPVFA